MKRLVFFLPFLASCNIICPDITLDFFEADYSSQEVTGCLVPSSCQPGSSGSRLSDSLALVRIYECFDGPHWPESGTTYAKTTFWLSDKPLERWCGVTTDSSWHPSDDWGYEQGCDGRVRALKLAVSTSVVPECLGDLALLESLVLSGPFKGRIPESLARLAFLQRLEISGAGCCISQCLDSIDISASIKHLCIDGDVYGSIPEWFSAFGDDACIRFDLMHRLSGRIPDSVVNKGFMTGGRRITYAIDSSDPLFCLYSLEGSCDIDYFILNAALYNRYALWYDAATSSPTGIHFVPDPQGGHWEWDSIEAAWSFILQATSLRQKQELP